MYLPSKRKELFRKYESALVWDTGSVLSDRLQGFHMLLRPCLGWLRGRLEAAYSFSSNEIESELYIFCCNIYLSFDRSKSSLVPYIEKSIQWEIQSMFRRLNRTRRREELIGLPIETLDTNNIEELIFKNTISKYNIHFTKGQKYLIYIVLVSDDKDLSPRGLSRIMNTDIRFIKKMIKQTRNILTKEYN